MALTVPLCYTGTDSDTCTETYSCTEQIKALFLLKGPAMGLMVHLLSRNLVSALSQITHSRMTHCEHTHTQLCYQVHGVCLGNRLAA